MRRPSDRTRALPPPPPVVVFVAVAMSNRFETRLGRAAGVDVFGRTDVFGLVFKFKTTGTYPLPVFNTSLTLLTYETTSQDSR